MGSRGKFWGNSSGKLCSASSSVPPVPSPLAGGARSLPHTKNIFCLFLSLFFLVFPRIFCLCVPLVVG